MKPYSQEFKHAYIDEFFRHLWSKVGGEWPWLNVETMVGSIYYVEGTDFVYVTPACPQYLGGEEFPDDDNVMIGVCRAPENGDYEDLGVLDFVLTYNMEQDLDTYHATVTALRAGLVRPRAEVTNA